MKVVPRKREVDEIVKLLESSEHDSAEALAKEVIKRTAELFADREWFAYAMRLGGPGGTVLAWGPLSSETEVRKFATKADLGLDTICVKLYSTGSMLTRIAEGEKGKSAMCLNCHHPHGAHEHPGQGSRCALKTCPCKQDVK